MNSTLKSHNSTIESLNPKEFIIIKGARVHNLKNIDLAIPRNRLIVITGLSGSGKSSLAFSTLYAEGQRRYVESLSAYARQFLGKIQKPDVDYIKGVAPAIAIEQKVNSTNSRSTVGTVTEIYDYLKLLYARIGRTVSPISGEEVKSDEAKDVLKKILNLPDQLKVYLLATVDVGSAGSMKKKLQLLLQQGYSRAFINKKEVALEDLIQQKPSGKQLKIVIDRFLTHPELEEEGNRIMDSAKIAFYEGEGKCELIIDQGGKFKTTVFSNAFEKDGIQFIKPDVHLFSFNNPLGACPTCEGFGKVIGIDEDLVIPNKSLSVYQNAIACWKGEKMQSWKNDLIRHAEKFSFPIHKPIFDLSDEQYQLLWSGNEYFRGLNAFFDHLSRKTYKIHFRVMLARYRGRTTCPDCGGHRLRKESSYVKVGGVSIQNLNALAVNDLKAHFEKIRLNQYEQKVARRILLEIRNRLDYLINVGLGYLSLNRAASSLSGGESQRINLATSLGSSLVGSMYILDEPSIGLHPKDTERLISILKSLRKLGNTVIVVEHDEDIIRAADEVIDLGPEAGSKGGNLVFQGKVKALEKSNTLTANYLNRTKKVSRKENFFVPNNFIQIKSARENNLKGIDVNIPLHCLTVVSGPSGSGKSSLVKKIIYPAIQKHLGGYGDKVGKVQSVEGDLNILKEIQFIDQNPIGRSSRSNPVTYIKAYDEIRALFSALGLSKSRGYKPAYFSFNVEGGRCDQCQGEGEIIEEMQFMADVHLICDVCGGKRFKDEILEVKYHQKSIADILDLTVDDAISFFSGFENDRSAKKVAEKLAPLQEVGLGYVKLGQASGTLSGGEAQRIKLASYLGKGMAKQHTLFIFDEPTTGLHFHDISNLLNSFDALLKRGHSLLVIEHNIEVIKHADWVVDLGPDGGDSGGELLFEGPSKELKNSERSTTARYL